MRSCVVVMLLLLSGCCTCKERYKPALTQWKENLERMRPTMVKGAATLPGDLGATKLGLYDRTTQGITRVLGAGPEAWGEVAPVTTAGGAK